MFCLARTPSSHPGRSSLVGVETRNQRGSRNRAKDRPGDLSRRVTKKTKDGEPFLGDATWKDPFLGDCCRWSCSSAALLGRRTFWSAVPRFRGAESHVLIGLCLVVVFFRSAHRDLNIPAFSVSPLLLVGILAVPFISNRGERTPSRDRRQCYHLVGLLSLDRTDIPWTHRRLVLHYGCVGKRSDADRNGQNSSPRELQGMLVFQNKNCRNCHAIRGLGGRRGPDLDSVGSRLTLEQLIDQVSNGTPGGGNMPGYGKQIKPAELEVLSTFLISLRNGGISPARQPLPREEEPPSQ